MPLAVLLMTMRHNFEAGDWDKAAHAAALAAPYLHPKLQATTVSGGGSPVHVVELLETLAERIAAGVVEDLVARLDPLLHPPLRRGIASSGPAARRMPLAEFLRPGGRAGKRGRGRGRAGGRGIQACPGGVRDAGRGG